jgi:transcriptional regulator with XRE-family HTH domain
MDTSHEAWITAIRTRLRDARLALGLSFNAAAEATGVPFASIQRMEAGRVDPTLLIARRLAHGYGVPLADVLADLEKRPKKK